MGGTTMYTVTQRFHFDGMDDERTEFLGSYTSKAVAEARALVATRQWSNIAHPAEIEETEVDAPLSDDEDQALMETLQDGNLDLDDEVVAALDIIRPNWRINA